MAEPYGRVHHVAYCMEPSDLAAAAEQLRAVTGATFAEFVRPDLGLHVMLAWSEGIELVAPLDEPGTASAHAREFLDTHGPGIFSVVVKVDDLEAAVARAEAAGARVVSRLSESVPEHDLVLEEATVHLPVGGLPLTLLQTNLP